MDINYGDVGGGGGPGGSNADWMHINAIDYNPLLDQIVISSRHKMRYILLIIAQQQKKHQVTQVVILERRRLLVPLGKSCSL